MTQFDKRAILLSGGSSCLVIYIFLIYFNLIVINEPFIFNSVVGYKEKGEKNPFHK